MIHGLKIATNINVFKAEDKDLQFSSLLNSFKIVKQQRVQISVPAFAGTVTLNVDHDLKYTPAFLAYAQLLDTTKSYSIDAFSVTSGKGESFQVNINKNRIQFILSSTDTSYTAQIYYYLFVNPGRDNLSPGVELIEKSKAAFGLLASTVKNVFKTSNINRVYNSELDIFRVFRFGQKTVNFLTGSAQTVIIKHGLNYRPAFLVFSELSAGNKGEFFLLPHTFPIESDRAVIPYADKENLYIRFGANHGNSNADYELRYFIFYNPAL